MKKPVFEILYFTSPACNVCKVLLPELKKSIGENFPEIQFTRISVEEDPVLAANHNIFSAPVILLLIDGKEYIRVGRNISIDDFIRKVQRLTKLAQ